MKSYRLREVFTPGGMPSVTYVDRQNLDLEKQLRSALARGHSIITVSGPTKSGKTVLCRTVIPKDSSVWIEGGRVRSIEDFWSLLADELQISENTTATKSSGSSRTTSIAADASVGIPGLIGAKGGGSSASGTQTSATIAKKFSNDLPSRCIKAATEKKRAIVIDDFHFLSNEVQKRVVNSLKGAIFDGLDVVVVAVPHRAFDPLSVQQEMQGRFIHIEVTKWTDKELMRIPELGFPALNIIVNPELTQKICAEGIGNPLLVQDLCFRLCSETGIVETQKDQIVILGDNLDSICSSVAENSGFPIFERLARGPQSRKDRRMRPLKRGGEVDIYQAILLAITSNGAKTVTPYDEIRSSLREILEDGGLPQKNEVTSACGHMSSIARNELENVEPIEWHNDALVVSDPFLTFYMRWMSDEIWERLAPKS